MEGAVPGESNLNPLREKGRITNGLARRRFVDVKKIFSAVAIIILSLGCSGPVVQTGSTGVSEETRSRRWELLSLQEKIELNRQPDMTVAEERLLASLKEEYAWTCLAESVGIRELPHVRARIEMNVNRVLFQELIRQKALTKLVTEADVQDYYSENKSRFFLPEEVYASHILITPRKEKTLHNELKSDMEGSEAATGLIMELGKKLNAGEDFSTLARQYSEDGLASAGGTMGWFGRGVMQKSFESAAFALQPGQISPVVETDYGYHIIRVTARRGGAYLPLEEVRRNIEDLLLSSKREEVAQVRLELEKEMKGVCYEN